MKGDSIIVEPHHRAAALNIVAAILPILEAGRARFTISVAGESGSGKSETATAIAQALRDRGIESVIFHQDDYFVHPPRTNDSLRRSDIAWVGTREVHLDLMDTHLRHFLDGASSIRKPLVDYAEDAITSEMMEAGTAQVAIADGTYTTLLENVRCRVFIERNFRDTREHREKRSRHASELDTFIDRVLEIEHEIISAHRSNANIVIHKDYTVTAVQLPGERS